MWKCKWEIKRGKRGKEKELQSVAEWKNNHSSWWCNRSPALCTETTWKTQRITPLTHRHFFLTIFLPLLFLRKVATLESLPLWTPPPPPPPPLPLHLLKLIQWWCDLSSPQCLPVKPHFPYIKAPPLWVVLVGQTSAPASWFNPRRRSNVASTLYGFGREETSTETLAWFPTYNSRFHPFH